MDAFIDSGWFGFTVMLLAAAAIIVSLAFGSHNRQVRGGIVHVGPFPTVLFLVSIIPIMAQGALPSSLVRTIPVSLILPGLDLALLITWLAVLGRELAASFRPQWTWRVGMRQIAYFLPVGLFVGAVYSDAATVPPVWWTLAGVEVAVILPFLLRLSVVGEPSS